MKNKISHIFVLGVLCPLLLFAAANEEHPPVTLQAFSGPGSVLLVWEVPFDSAVYNIRLHRSSDLMLSYQTIELDTLVVNRYLDEDVTVGDLLFYKLEIELTTGDTVYSDQLTPVFARPIENIGSQYVLTQRYSRSMSERDKINDLHTLQTTLFHDYCNSRITVPIDTIQALLAYFLLSDYEYLSFLDVLSIDDFNTLGFLLTAIDKDELKLYLDQAFQELEPVFRQAIWHTPAEWNAARDEMTRVLTAKLIAAENIYRADLEFLETLSAVRITGLLNNGQHWSIQIDRFAEIDQVIQLRSGSDLIDGVEMGTIIIPEEWNTVELWLGDELLQSLPQIDEIGTMSIALDDQYVFSDDSTFGTTMRSIPEEDYELNEIGFTSYDRKLQVEIAGNSDWSEQLGIFLNDSLLWDWSTTGSYGIMFMDSNWIIPHDLENAWLHLCQHQNDEWVVLESRPLILIASFRISKIPDRGAWTAISYTTFGESNDITKSQKGQEIIPDIFALYQNFPNPFNASTKITFDLLKTATVSLFISDARGRVLEVFLEEMFLEKGQYTFNWSPRFRSSGVYFITIEAQSDAYFPVVMSRKMIYLK